MLDVEAARSAALSSIEAWPDRGSGEWRIVDERETPSAFVFSCAEYIDGEPQMRLGGAPVVVPKDGRDPHPLFEAHIEFLPCEGIVDRIKRWWARRKY